MKNILKNTLQTITVLTAIASLSSCGGGGGSTTPATGASNVSGVVVDGPIYGATITIFAKSDTSFTNPLATTTTTDNADNIGGYSVDVKNLSDEYIIKVAGGKDTGPDGIKNANDEAGVDMFAVAKKTTGDNTTHISPATTIEAEFVMHNNATLDEAKSKTQKLFNTELDFTKINPKENEIAAKAGVIIAQIAESLPTDKSTAIKAIARELQTKNTQTFNISSGSVELKNISFSSIAGKVNDIKSGEISDSAIAKISKGSTTFKTIIENTTNKIKPAVIQSDVVAVAAHKSLQKIKQLVYANNIDEIDFDGLETKANNLEDSFIAVLEDGIDKLNNDNLDVITDIVLDKGKIGTAQIKDIAGKTANITGDTKTIIKNVYKNTSVANLGGIDNIDFNALDSLIISGESDEFKEDMYKTIAYNISKAITTTTSSVDIDKIANKTIKNDAVKNAIRGISKKKKDLKDKTTLTNDEKASLRAEELSFQSLQESLTRSTTFTAEMADNLATMKTQIQDKILVLQQNITNLEELFAKTKALEIASKNQDLSSFDSGNLEQDITKINNLVDKFIGSTTENTDFYESVNKIDEYFNDELQTKNIDTVITDIDNDIYDYIEDKQSVFVMPYIPMPPAIDGFNFNL